MMQVRSRYVRALRTAIKTGSGAAPTYMIPHMECTVQQFCDHLEKMFKEGMTWENYGKVWHVDHVTPLKFGGNPSMEEIIKRLHFSNTQPMFAAENLSKRNRRVG
jgi:hypothetical protein